MAPTVFGPAKGDPTMTLTKCGLAALLALGVAASTPVAFARTADAFAPDDVRIVVAYGDLDLATPAGADALRFRVDRAAMQVKGQVDPRDLAGMAELRKARAAAREAADAIIDAHRGTAYAGLHPAPSRVHL
jgi:UrcA family protein